MKSRSSKTLPIGMRNLKPDFRRYFTALVGQLREDARRYPGYPDIRNRLGLCMAFMGKDSAALVEFDKALKVNRNYIECLTNNAYSVCSAVGPEEAADGLRPALERLDNPWLANTMGRMLAVSGDWRDALAMLADARRGSKRLMFAFDHALCRLALDPADSTAARTLRRLAENEPGYRRLIGHHRFKTSGSVTRRRLANFFRVNPNFHKVFVDIAKILANEGDLRAARSLFMRAERFVPDSSFAQHALGTIHMARGEVEKARHHFLRAIRFDPLSVNSYLNLAYMAASGGRNAEAVRWLKKAVREAPAYPDLRYQLGSFLLQTGRYDEARPHLEKALLLNPHYAFARFGLATCLFHTGEYERVLEIYQELAPETLDIAEIHAQKAACHLLLGRPELAIEECVELIPAEHHRAAVLLYLARAYSHTERPKEARRLLERVKREYPDTSAAEKAQRLLAIGGATKRKKRAARGGAKTKGKKAGKGGRKTSRRS